MTEAEIETHSEKLSEAYRIVVNLGAQLMECRGLDGHDLLAVFARYTGAIMALSELPPEEAEKTCAAMMRDGKSEADAFMAKLDDEGFGETFH